MKYAARENKKHLSNLSINASIDGQGLSYFAELLQGNDYLENEKISEFRKIISDIEPDEFELVFFVYYNNFSLTDYAAKKGISYSKIIRKKNFILEKLGFKLEQS